MTPTKLLIGQIFVVFAIVIGASWSATQWTAARLAHQPRLGPSWFELAGAPGRERFEYFTNRLARRLAGGKNMVRDVLEEIGAGEAGFFTDAELDALKAVRAEIAGAAGEDAAGDRENGSGGDV